jgi:hypothetical protein
MLEKGQPQRFGSHTITGNLADIQEKHHVDAGVANPPFEPAQAKIQAAVS